MDGTLSPLDLASRPGTVAAELAALFRRTGIAPPALDGHIDAYTSTGYVEGWAFDRNDAGSALPVAVLHDGAPIASGLAHQYRADLVEAGCGTAWCAFRLRVTGPVARLRLGTFHLRDLRTDVVFCETRNLRLLEDGGDEISSVDALLADDPTVVTAVEQLRGCSEIFNRFIQVRGVDAFVRCMYSYILNRPADRVGAAIYASHIRRATLTAFQVAEAIADSDEFRARRPMLAAPTSAAFPFTLEA